MTTDLRKELRQLVMESYDKGVADAMEAATAAVQAAVTAEREACLAEFQFGRSNAEIKAAIRARGNK